MLWILFTGCASFREVERPNRAFLDQHNLERLEGIYESMPVQIEELEHFNEHIGIGDTPHQNFLFDRFRLAATKDHAASAHKYVVKIDVVDENKILLELMSGSETIKTLKIRGKYKNGYFYRRPQVVVVPFVPLLFGYRIQKQRIGIEEDMLIVDLRENRWAFFLLAGQNENSQHEAKYRKIENQ